MLHDEEFKGFRIGGTTGSVVRTEKTGEVRYVLSETDGQLRVLRPPLRGYVFPSEPQASEALEAIQHFWPGMFEQC